MASTISAGEQLVQEETEHAEATRSRGALWLNLGLRTRQIALITLFVAFVVILILAALGVLMSFFSG